MEAVVYMGLVCQSDESLVYYSWRLLALVNESNSQIFIFYDLDIRLVLQNTFAGH